MGSPLADRITRWGSASPGIAAGAILLIVYILTLAPGVTLWDSGEFLAAIHALGIPHPPGTPLYVIGASVWAKAFGPLLGFAWSINLLSAVFTAAACALLGTLVSGWMRSALAGVCAGVVAGGMSTVWLNATETEVYAASLFVAMLLVWIGDRAGVTGDRRWFFMLVYVGGLAAGLHLTALVALPAAVWLAAGRPGLASRLAKSLPLAALGASVILFMLVRAQHDPGINQGNPETFAALGDVVTRSQYRPAGLWPRQAPWFIQVGNLFEYADWQIALGISSGAPPSWSRTPLTVGFAMLGGLGFREHRRSDRRSWRAMLVLVLTATLGVILYLNLKAGPTFGAGFIPENAPHEARERDYFFAAAFVCWGAWSGIGAARLAELFGRGGLRWMAMAVAVFPIAANWSAVDRSRGPRAAEARELASRLLSSAPPRAVLFAHGDNDTYPLWYLQRVEGVRRDVTVVTLPMLGAQWYREELRRRSGLLSPDAVTRWAGLGATRRSIEAHASAAGRPVVESDLGLASRKQSKH